LYNEAEANMGSQEKLGKNIKKARKKAGITQNELAEKVGVHASYISRIERGVVNPSYEVVESIAKALKVKSSDILPF
jgi:XRE family transcriptional regulator, regulator of sulfur utilization